jgi:hypothetical protein
MRQVSPVVPLTSAGIKFIKGIDFKELKEFNLIFPLSNKGAP